MGLNLYRGFESLRLRQIMPRKGHFFFALQLPVIAPWRAFFFVAWLATRVARRVHCALSRPLGVKLNFLQHTAARRRISSALADFPEIFCVLP
jgi:hypothetical protein